MKVAVLGPIAKDIVKIDNKISVQIGGIPYYIALALQALEIEKITPYITCAPSDKRWATNNFPGLAVQCLPAEKTLESTLEYSSDNPDFRKHLIKCYQNTIEANHKLIKELEDYDYIIFGPLFHDNIPLDLFKKLSHKKLVLGNFGLFTYGENNQFVRKNPEKLIKILPYLSYLFLDASEAKFVSGKDTLKEAAEFCRQHGLANMIITEGSRGSHLFIGKNYYSIPAFPPKKLADPTGAGDTYLAAFIRALELFDDPEKQGRFAAMVATMSLEKSGAFRGSLNDVLKRLKF